MVVNEETRPNIGFTSSSSIDLLPVEKYEINIYDSKEVENALENPMISEEVKSDIYHLSTEQYGDNGEIKEVILFSPDLITAKSTTVTYKTFNGKRMKNEKLFVSRTTNMVEITKGTKPGDTIANIIFEITSMTEGNLSLWTSGISVYKFFLDNFGEKVVGGSSSSRLEAGLLYNTYIQYTYSETSPNSNQWLLGLVSQQTTLKKIDFRLHINKNGIMNTYLGSSTRNDYLSTRNYSNPWSVAYYNYNSPTTESIRFKIGTKIFNGK